MHLNEWARRASLLTMTFLTACASIGPGTVQRDRFDYSSAVADSWKQQALLNIVKMRYGDNVVFVDVANIVAGYSLQTGIAVTGVVSSKEAIQGDYGSIGGQAVYTERPTITYVPLTGQQYMRGIMTPIAPSSILFLIQAGYAADAVMLMSVESINGLENNAFAPARRNAGDPRFFQVVELIRKAQRSGDIGMRVELDKARKETTVLTFQRRDPKDAVRPESAEIRRLLNLDPDASEFRVVYGMKTGGGSDIDMATRSVYQIMLELSGTVEVPKAHMEDGSTLPVPALGEDVKPLMRVRSGTTRPANAFATVQYQGHWFWIDRSDMVSKRTFSFLMALFNFAETGKTENLPLVTIPAQ